MNINQNQGESNGGERSIEAGGRRERGEGGEEEEWKGGSSTGGSRSSVGRSQKPAEETFLSHLKTKSEEDLAPKSSNQNETTKVGGGGGGGGGGGWFC